MPNYDFSQPHRQSRIGLVLIFMTALFHLVRNLWVVLLYFLVRDVTPETLVAVFTGLLFTLIGTLVYSIFAYRNFMFHIDERNKEFVLQKGVISTDTTNIPFDKIQQVQFKRNLLQRLIGIYSVVIETAGSQEKEIEIKALLEDKANALADRLMDLKHSSSAEGEKAPVEDQEKEPLQEWQYKVPLSTLFKLGLTSNYLRGVALIITFYLTLREQVFLRQFFPSELSGQEIMEQASLIFLLALLFVGMFITVAETLIKYFDLNLKQFRDSLQVEMGLRNNTKVSIRSGRVQMMEIHTNPIQKKLGLYGIKLSLASSEDDLEKNRVNIPGLPPDVITKVKSFFFKESLESALEIRPHKIVLWRKISRGLFPAILALLLGWGFQELIPLRTVGGLVSLYLVLLSIYTFFYYRTLKLSFSDHTLEKCAGIWMKKKQYLELYRLQSVSVRQPLWYKRRGIVNLTFHSAGGDISFDGVKKEQITPLVNFVLYRIEKTTKSWM